MKRHTTGKASMRQLFISSIGTRLAAVVICALFFSFGYDVSSAQEPIPITVDAGWSATSTVPPAFTWTSESVFAEDGRPFTFTSGVPTILRITDDFCQGDEFRIFDNGVALGDTSDVAANTECVEQGPDAAFANPSYSKASFSLSPGSHSITIQIIARYTPGSGGRGYIRVDSAVVANNDAYSTNEDTALSISAPGVLANDAGGSMTAELVATAEHGALTLNSNGSFSYVPNPNFNGVDSFFYIAKVGSKESNIASVTLNVNAVNDPPFFDPIADQYVNPPVTEPQTVQITGIVPGPPNESGPGEFGQSVALSATSNNALVSVSSPIATEGTVGTLTYQRTSSSTGTATITVTAQDNGGGTDTFTRTFDIVIGASGTVEANLTGFTPNPDANKAPTVQVTVTARPIDWNGNGVIDVPGDCYRIFHPQTGRYNIVPSGADRSPEGPPWRIPTRVAGVITNPGDTEEICNVARNFTANVDLSEWITRTGEVSTDLEFVSLIRDLECLVDPAECVERLWTGTRPVGTINFTSGPGATKVADVNKVTLHTVNTVGGTTTASDEPLEGAVARVFNRNDPAFQNQRFGVPLGPRIGKNPDGSFYDDIFESQVGQIATCTTPHSGVCIATETQVGDYLVVVKFVDKGVNKVVYDGLPKGVKEFVNGVATKSFTIVKKLTNGNFTEYQAGNKTVVKDCTQVLCP